MDHIDKKKSFTAEPEILVDDEGRREEWRPVKKWKFVDGGTWVDILYAASETQN